MSERPIEVTVVLPTRDRWPLAEAAVRSALEQEDVELEIRLVDDGSLAAAPRSLADDPRIEIVRHESSRGVAASRNRAIGEARGTWVAFLDDDDVWEPSHLRRLVASAERAGAPWAFSGYVKTNLKRAPVENGPVPIAESDPQRQFLHANPVGTPSCVLVATDAVRELGGFDEQLSVMADWDLWVRLAAAGRPAVSTAFTVGYAQHGGNMSLDVNGAQAEWARMAARYERELDRLGLEFADNEYFWRWLARGYAAGRRRRPAVRYFLRAAARGGGVRDVARALSVVPVLGWPVVAARWGLAVARRRPRRGGRQHPWLQSFAVPAADGGSASPSGQTSQRCGVRTSPSP